MSVLACWGLLTCGWLRVASREIMLISTPDICGRRHWPAVSCLHAPLPLLPTQTSSSPPDTLWAPFGAHRIRACPSLKTATADSQRTSLLLLHRHRDRWELPHALDCTRERMLLTPVFMGLPRCRGGGGEIRYFRIWLCHH